jgi:hypothetical protein
MFERWEVALVLKKMRVFEDVHVKKLIPNAQITDAPVKKPILRLTAVGK